LRQQYDDDRHRHERNCGPPHPRVLRTHGRDRERQAEGQQGDGREVVGIGVDAVPERPTEIAVPGHVVLQRAARGVDQERHEKQQDVRAQLLRRAQGVHNDEEDYQRLQQLNERRIGHLGRDRSEGRHHPPQHEGRRPAYRGREPDLLGAQQQTEQCKVDPELGEKAGKARGDQEESEHEEPEERQGGRRGRRRHAPRSSRHCSTIYCAHVSGSSVLPDARTNWRYKASSCAITTR